MLPGQVVVASVSPAPPPPKPVGELAGWLTWTSDAGATLVFAAPRFVGRLALTLWKRGGIWLEEGPERQLLLLEPPARVLWVAMLVNWLGQMQAAAFVRVHQT